MKMEHTVGERLGVEVNHGAVICSVTDELQWKSVIHRNIFLYYLCESYYLIWRGCSLFSVAAFSHTFFQIKKS